MSEYITHVCLNDDLRRLALHDPTTSPAIRLALTRHHRVSRLGAVASRGDRHSIELLRHVQKHWPRPDAERMLAFQFGWRSHIAADRQLKTLFRLLDPQIYRTPAVDGPTDVSMHHDLFLLREVYDGGKLDPFTLDMLAEHHACEGLDPVFTRLWQARLLRLHGSLHRAETPSLWIELAASRRQKFYVEVARYIEAFHHPDKQMIAWVVRENRFYDRSDPLIRLARSIQRGRTDSSIDLDEAVEAAGEQSHYARALTRGVRYNRATVAFIEGRIGVAELAQAYESAHPHTSAAVRDAVHESPDRREQLLEQWHEGAQGP